MIEPQVTEEPPKELNYKNVCFWSEHYKRLEGFDGVNTIRSKAKMFVKLKLIQYDPQGIKYDPFDLWKEPTKHKFICKPLPRNHVTYRLNWNKELNDFECSCQYFQTKMLKNEKPYCSHWLGLYLYLKILGWNKDEKRN